MKNWTGNERQKWLDDWYLTTEYVKSVKELLRKFKYINYLNLRLRERPQGVVVCSCVGKAGATLNF